MRWGPKYGPEYVNRLFSAVQRHLDPPFRFLCLTDDASGLDEGIETAALPVLPLDPSFFIRASHGEGWRKIGAFQRGFANLEGPVLFLDIDIVIVGDLNRLFEFEPGRFCIIRDWLEINRRPFRRLFNPNFHPQADSNSSVFRFEMPKHGYVHDHLLANKEWAHRNFRLQQQYLGAAVGDRAFWPAEWVVSFKRSCRRRFPLNHFLEPRQPENASIIVFHGHPHPDEAIAGYDGGLLRSTKPARWLDADWR
jgi:hypothetical protein